MATLVYLWKQGVAGREFLMIHRGGREDDFHSGKWNGLGGKLEGLESPWEAAAREVREESGLSLSGERLRWQGMLHFPNFRPLKSEDWWCCVMSAELTAAEAQSVPDGSRFSEEGSLHWIPEGRILELNLWEGDRTFLPKVLAGDSVFGTLRYEQGRLAWFRLECPPPFT